MRNPRFKDLTGQVFGLLTVVQEAGKVANGLVLWECLCECGRVKNVRGACLRNGETTSCGRHMAEIRGTHGKSRDPIYARWHGMVQRCTDSNHSRWKVYGQRGIRVCERWMTFENFYEDMGDPPFPRASLEREDNDGNYEPGNVRWATTAEQARNSSRTVKVTMKGRTQCLKDWAEELGIAYSVVKRRYELGWLPEDALTVPVHSAKRYSQLR